MKVNDALQESPGGYLDDLLDFDAAAPAKPNATHKFSTVPDLFDELDALNNNEAVDPNTCVVAYLKQALQDQEFNNLTQLNHMREKILESLVSDQNLQNFELSKLRHQIRNEDTTLKMELLPSDNFSKREKAGLSDEENDFEDFGAVQMRKKQYSEEIIRETRVPKTVLKPKEEKPVEFLNDLIGMNFDEAPAGEDSQPAEGPLAQSKGMLLNIFAQFGLDLNKEESDPIKDHKEETEDKDMSIPVPDFNTVDFKVKRILDAVPDFSYLFAN